MHLFIFDRALVALEDRSYDRHLLLPQSMPFVLRHDGSPHDEINAFLESRPIDSRARSPKTWKAYASDLTAWGTFAESQSVPLLGPVKPLRHLVNRYRDLRFAGDLVSRWEPATWNRHISTVACFYQWAAAEGLIARVPFTYKTKRVNVGGQVRDVHVNQARMRDAAEHAKIHWLETDYLHFFLSVGMAGRLPSGSDDPRFKGRNGARNEAAATFAAASGLRVAEFSNLLIWELPDLPRRVTPFVDLPLPARICKNSVARHAWVNPEALQLVHDYVGLERHVVTVGSSWRPEGEPLFVTDPDRDGGRINGRRRAWRSLTIDERRRLIAPGGGSAMVFVALNGGPVEQWQYAYDRAVQRCREFEPSFPHVSPHVMRHTFMVHTLRDLTGRSLADLTKSLEVTAAEWAFALRSANPLMVLRDLAGHASVTTSERYQKLVDTSRLFTEAVSPADIHGLGAAAHRWPPGAYRGAPALVTTALRESA